MCCVLSAVSCDCAVLCAFGAVCCDCVLCDVWLLCVLCAVCCLLFLLFCFFGSHLVVNTRSYVDGPSVEGVVRRRCGASGDHADT